MTESSENKSNSLPIPAIVSLLLLLVGAVVQHLNPLDSPRPSTPSEKSSRYANIEDVNARLWQDPFSVVSQHDSANDYCPTTTSNKKTAKPPENKCDSKHSLDSLVSNIADIYKKKQKTTILGVMVSSESYAENIENRRRTRYAVLSGLAVANYAPRDQEHIGYVENKGQSNNMGLMPEKIPFEWFQSDEDDSRPPILVLWLDDTVFASQRKPLEMIADFVNLITKELNKQINSNNSKSKIVEAEKENFRFRFIGPANSNTLQIMIDEIAEKIKDVDTNEEKLKSSTYEEKVKPRLNSLQELRFYNAVATSDWPGMNIPPTHDNRELKVNGVEKTIQIYLDSLNLNRLFTRTSLSDYQLAETLLKELELRVTGLKKELKKNADDAHRNHIVIISEWDTIYARRGLPDAMKHQFVKMESYCNKDEIKGNKCQPMDVSWIHSFNYMRGLDGVTLGTEKKSEDAKVNKDKNSAETNLERPEGESQQDYVRRLAAHINELQQELKNNEQGETIKAIGILGSDAYDKLMILKALRPYFPKVLFFTTDLDTRLMHPKEFDVTRNLIVASSFDLHLAESLQKSIPPFRDSYQTANFFATQIAVDDANNTNDDKLHQSYINSMLGTARLFETANNKAIALNYRSIKGDYCKTLQDCFNAHPPLAPQNSSRDIAIVSFLVVVLWGIPCGYFLNKYWRSTTRKFWFFGIGFEAVVLLSVWAVVYFTNILHEQDGEPFFWTEGISIWPSELIRLFAGLLACLFIADTVNAVLQNNQELEERFEFNLGAPTTGDVEALWNRFYSKNVIKKCSLGVIISVALFIGFGIWTVDAPFVPYRGDTSLMANNIVLKFSVWVFVVLIMTVCAITLHSAFFIKALDEDLSIWPDEKLRKLGLLNRSNPELRILRSTLFSEKKYFLHEWLDIKFIATYSKVVGKLIYYPFIILALMIFARSKIFDNWDVPIGLMIVFSTAAILTLGSAFYLRYVAEKTRKTVLKHITDMKVFLTAQPKSTAHDVMEKQIDFALIQIQEINEGAFQSLTRDPAVQAILIPFGGVGGVMLLENLLLGF